MRLALLCCLLTVTLFTATAQKSGSLNSRGGRFVGFTIDGDTRAGQAKIYPAGMPYFHDDDWFKRAGYSGYGKGVFDAADSTELQTRLKANENFSFVKRMAGQPYDIKGYFPTGDPNGTLGHQFWVDGVYFRDYHAVDSTAFTSANKNGQNPNIWLGGVSNVGAKSDIIDVFTHVRTSGIDPKSDSVWFFAGVSTKGVVGERYFDIEVYREPIYFTPAPSGEGQRFVSEGTSYGHSKWSLDATGTVIQTGDIIVSVAYKSGVAPEIDFRIWLARTTYDSIVAQLVTPKTFALNGRWELADDGVHGYAEITAPNPADEWGSGLGNFLGSAIQDSTFATPWGTINTGGAWSQHYDQLQFVEIGLNFSRFGMNPFSYVESFCKSPYASIIVKSRSSTAFNANLDDFVGPVSFSVKNIVPFSVTPEPMTCIKNDSKLAFNFDARNYYRLINSNGDTLAKDVDFRTAATAADRYLTVNQTGTYKVEATNFQGCPAMQTTTIDVVRDNITPDPLILVGNEGANYKLIGSATTAPATFGPSQGYSYAWTGPTGSTLSSYTAKEPLITTYVQGTYSMTVTEARNGCTALATAYIMGVLKNNFQLHVISKDGANELTWNNPDAGKAASYTIERSFDGLTFHTIRQVSFAYNSQAVLSYRDAEHQIKPAYYRIKSIQIGSTATYSNIAYVWPNTNNLTSTIYKSGNSIEVMISGSNSKQVTVQVLDLNGCLLTQRNIPTNGGSAKASIALSPSQLNKMVIVTLTGDRAMLQSKKVF